MSLIASLLFNPDLRVARAARAALFALAAAVVALIIGIAGPLYGPAAVMAVLAALLILRDMRWGLAALFGVIGFLPFAALPFKIGFTPTFLDVALFALYFVWVLRVATRRQAELIGTALGAPVLVFLLLALFAFAHGLPYSRPTATTIRNFAELLLAIGFFFVLVNTLQTQKDIDLVARLIMLAGAAAAALAIIFYVIPQAWTIRVLDALARFNYPGGAGALRYIEDDSANPMRAIGTMIDPNVLGGFLILVGGLTAPQVVTARPLFSRRWAALFLIFELLALYLTYSRGSLAGLAAGLLLVGFLRYRKLLLVIVVGAVLLLLLPPAQEYVAHFVEGIRIQDRATLMRLGEYKDALSLISRYPWFGVGFAGAPDADLYIGVSNLYLLVAEEMGLLGLTGFVVVVSGFLIIVFVALWRGVTSSGTEALLLGLMAAIAGAMVGGIFDHYLFNLVYPHMAVMFWTLLGLGMAAIQLTRKAGPSVR